MESCIKQNNAIEIYQDYFSEIDEATDCEEPKAKVNWKIFTKKIVTNYYFRQWTCTVTLMLLMDTWDQWVVLHGIQMENSKKKKIFENNL